MLTENLDVLLSQLTRHGNPVADFLQPGLSRSLINSRTKSLPIHLPEEIYELYSWRNGSLTQNVAAGDIGLIMDYWLMSLEDAIKTYERFAQNQLWYGDKLRPDWFPVFTNLSGDYYLVECSGASNQAHAIREHQTDELNSPIIYVSLTAMIQTINECFATGVYIVEDDGWIEIDEASQKMVARKYNPNVAYWLV